MSENSNAKSRNSFSGSIGFVLAAAGSAVGLGNIWRFPYLAARGKGGLFLVIYLVLAVTFGFTLLTAEVAMGRKAKQSPLTAYKKVCKRSGFIGVLAALVPFIILPYYCVIGGWVIKYLVAYIIDTPAQIAADGYFTGFITQDVAPIITLVVFLAMVAFVVFRGVNNGIESFSKVLMPLLLIMVIGIAAFALTITHTDSAGVTRTGLQGLKVYLVPDLKNITPAIFFRTVVDAMGQLFFSLSVAMGIMVAYGSYVSDDAKLMKSINQIEIFDTAVAFLAGVMIIPTVYAFSGREGMDSSGPSLIFVSLPKIFSSMGFMGRVLAVAFFAMVLFAALTSAVSVMEAVVASFIDKFGMSRTNACIVETIIGITGGIIVCLGYNKLYFEVSLPNGGVAQILDILDYISNSVLMPIVAISECILIGWILKPKFIIDEVEKTGDKFGRKYLFTAMIKYITPVLLLVILLQSLGLVKIG